MQKNLLLSLSITLSVCVALGWWYAKPSKPRQIVERRLLNPEKAGKKKTLEERYAFTEARLLHEYYMQVSPLTGTIPPEEKYLEIEQSERAPRRSPYWRSVISTTGYTSRGPSNLGGRTRCIAFDRSDATGNTVLAGGVSGGVYRTTNGGASWTRVSPLDRQHNATALAQDPRPGFQNIWYYATGEALGNSASEAGSFYAGHGVWRSTNGGLTWDRLPLPAGVNNEFALDHRFDLLTNLAVHPSTGDLFVAALGCIYRWRTSTSTWITELTAAGGFNSNQVTDVVVTAGGRLYAAFAGACPAAQRGIWTSNDATGAGAGTWMRIATNGTPAGWAQGTGAGRAVLALAPSNQNLLYVLYDRGTVSSCAGTPAPEAHLWRFNQGTSAWTDFSATLPDETGCSDGNDPFAIQGGYDLVVSVKPDNANFVVIGGTNAYRKTDITAAGRFGRIGGYAGTGGYALYNAGGVEHHPDIHAMVFHPTNANILWTGTDGGVHRTNNVTAATVNWVNLNNNYQTYQYYYIGADPQAGADIVIGGAQDNGTTAGGLDIGMPTLSEMMSYFGGDGCAVAVSRANACIPFYFSTQNGSIFRDCPTFANIRPTGSVSEFVTYFYLDPVGTNNLYYAGTTNVWRNNNATGATAGNWTNMGALSTIPPGGFTDYVRCYATTPGAYNAASSYLFIGTDEGKVFRLLNPRGVANVSTAVNITPAGAVTTYPSIVSQIAVHPTNPNIVMAVYSNYGIPSIFVTSNATAASPTWTQVERNISALSVRSAAIASVGGQDLFFVGTTRGLYSSVNPLTTDWVLEGESTIGFSVVNHLVYRPSDQTLFVGTHGNGIYQTSIAIPVPVTWMSFSGKKIEDYALLSWQTAVETNSRGFEVERSTDGGAGFEYIGFVPSLPGDEMQTRSYTFKDHDLRVPVQYYRLRQVDLDESATYSKIIAIEIQGEATDFAIYPNPLAANRFKVQFSSPPQKRVELELYDLYGKMLWRQRYEQPERLLVADVSGLQLPAGSYILRVLQDGALVRSEKIQKI